MRFRLLESLNEHVTRDSHAPAIRQVTGTRAPTASEVTTYSDLAQAVWGMAARLSRDAAEGEVVLLASPNDAQFVASFLAILAAGAKAFPVSPELTEPELLAAVEQAAPTLVIGTQPVLAALRGKVRTLMPISEATAHRARAAPARSGGARAAVAAATPPPKPSSRFVPEQ